MQPLRPRPIVLFEQKRRGKVARNLFHVDLRYPHPLITVPGFEVSQVRGCTMRIVNLGILQNFNGSVVSLLVSHGLLENNSNICVVVFDGGEPDRVSFSVRFSIPPYAFLTAGFFGGGSADDHFRVLSARFRQWARVHQYQ